MELFYCLSVIFVIFVAKPTTVATDQLNDTTIQLRKDRWKSAFQACGSDSEDRCLLSCYLNKLEVINKDNWLVLDKLYLIFDEKVTSISGKTITQESEDLATTCNNIVADTDRCKSALMLYDCLENEAKDKGFEEQIFVPLSSVLPDDPAAWT